MTTPSPSLPCVMMPQGPFLSTAVKKSAIKHDVAELCTIDSVFSVSVDGSGTLACSGGKDDQGMVWKVADGSIAFKCQGK